MIETGFRSTIARTAIDLRYRHFETEKHGIKIIGTWLTDKNNTQPCMVLLHGGRDIRAGKTVPCIIALDQAWRWAQHGDVGDPAHAARIVTAWLECGALPGSHHSWKDRLKVLDAVNSRLPDLIAMPPQPRFNKLIIGDAIIRDADTGRTIEEREIVNNV